MRSDRCYNKRKRKRNRNCLKITNSILIVRGVSSEVQFVVYWGMSIQAKLLFLIKLEGLTCKKARLEVSLNRLELHFSLVKNLINR